MAKNLSKDEVFERIHAHGKEHYWDDMIETLECGEMPHRELLVLGLRSVYPPPEIVREFIADLIEGKRKYPKGNPGSVFSDLRQQIYRGAYRAASREIFLKEEYAKRSLVPDRHMTVCEMAAEALGVSSSTIDKASSGLANEFRDLVKSFADKS